ncbi:MAG: response regulator transcription factor [Actinomycetota bacterium]|nr:response regulator transcription factor [Actinomycetota bacterium]
MPHPEAATRVFVVDDHELVRRAVADVLSNCDDLEFAGAAGTMQEALDGMAEARPDIALIDMRLPDGDGVELTRALGARHPEVRCLIHTSVPDEKTVIDTISAGAFGYVLKDSSVPELVAAIRRVAAGEASLDPAVTGGVLAQVRRGAKQAEELSRLTEREQAILDLLAQGLSNREIASRVHAAEQTVKNQVSSLLGKLGLQSRTQAAVYAANLKREG